MRYWSLIIVLCIVSPVMADQAANGSNGINSRVTGLDGSGGCCVIGQVENQRPGKAGYDSPSNSVSNTVPIGIFFQTAGGQDAANSSNIGNHPTSVANLMIGDVTLPTYE